MLRRARTLLIALLGLAGCTAALPAAAGAASGPDYIGVNLQPMMKDTSIAESRWGSFLSPLRDGQMTISRIDINWNLVEQNAPVRGVHKYDWNSQLRGPRGSIDFLMASAAAYGIRAVPTFTAPPVWVYAGGSRLPDAQFGNFTDFVTAFAARYGPGGAFWAQHPELPSLPVQTYEIWNEANSNNSWTGHPDPGAYARLLQVVYPRLKAVQPGGAILASVGWVDAAPYLASLIAAGGNPFFDGVAFHPYAPNGLATIALVTKLRAFLASVGRSNSTIYVTETGQPAALAGQGAQHSYTGTVSDSTRAASVAFAADAIGRSDCGVNDYLVYAVTGSETTREPLSEGFMGLLRYADGTPTQTGAALQAAGRRWVQYVAAGGPARGRLALCSQGDSPDGTLLPLELVLAPVGRSCVAGSVGYYGHPLESATLTLTRPDGKNQALPVDAYGNTTVCVPAGPKVQTVDVQASVPKTARSGTYRCAVPLGTCELVQSPPGAVAAAKACTWAITVQAQSPRRIKGSARSRTKVRARAVCPGLADGTRLTFVVGLKPKGRTHERRVRTVILKNQRTITFTATAKVKSGDRLSILHRADRKTGIAKIKQLVTLKAPKR